MAEEEKRESKEGSAGEGAKNKAQAALAQGGQFAKDHWKAIGVVIAGITLVFVYLQYRNSQVASTTPSVASTDPNAVTDTSLGGNPTVSTTGGGGGGGAVPGGGGGGGGSSTGGTTNTGTSGGAISAPVIRAAASVQNAITRVQAQLMANQVSRTAAVVNAEYSVLNARNSVLQQFQQPRFNLGFFRVSGTGGIR